jgi:hypothetical protein
MTTYLRFPDEATAKTALACYVDAGGSWITASHEHALDPVGTITTPGTYDEAGNELTAPVAQPGWHVNLIGAVPDAAASYVVDPASPVRVFA